MHTKTYRKTRSNIQEKPAIKGGKGIAFISNIDKKACTRGGILKYILYTY